MFFYDWTYFILVPAIILSLYASARVNLTFSKYQKVSSRAGVTATELARALLHAEGIDDVSIERVGGKLTDHYDPSKLTLRLSDSTASSTSVAALSVAAHECGHVLQHRDGYSFLALRSASVPVVNIGSRLSYPLFLVGLIVGWSPLLNLGILLFSLVVAFSLITLPVEFNASRRALAVLEGRGFMDADELNGARKVLNAAALTYVASAATAILQLLRLLMIAGMGRRDD